MGLCIIIRFVDKTESDELGSTEAKMKHNLALALYGKNGGTEKLLEELKDIEAKYYSSRGGKQKGTGGGGATAGDTDRIKGHSFELDASLVLYNQAVVLVHLQLYKSAVKILEGLFRYIEAVDENVALCICFLLLELYSSKITSSGDTNEKQNSVILKSQEIIDFLEKPHGFNGLQRPDSAGSSPSTDPPEEQSKDTSRQVSEFRFRLHMYKAKLRVLESNVKGSRKEVKSALEVFQRELKSFGEDSDGLCLGLLMEQPTMDKAGKEKEQAKEAVDPLDVHFNSPALCLKANLEYLRSNHRKSIKLLQSCSKSSLEEGIFFNNMGCIHHSLGQHRCASMYFARSLDYYQSRPTVTSNKGIDRSKPTSQRKKQANPTQSSSKEKSVFDAAIYDVYLNTGIQLLHSGHPKLAYSCFQEAALANYHRPRLWMYIAQCVVLAVEKEFTRQRPGNAPASTSTSSSSASRKLYSSIQGEGSLRRFKVDVAGSHRAKEEWSRQNAGSDFHCSEAFLPQSEGQRNAVKEQQRLGREGLEAMKSLPPLSLEAGLRATANALFLLEDSYPDELVAQAETDETMEDQEDGGGGEDSDGEGVEATSSNAKSKPSTLLSIAITTLLCRSYIALWLQDWSIVVSACSKALKLLSALTSPTVLQLKQQATAYSYISEAFLKTGLTDTAYDSASKALQVVEDSMKAKEEEENGNQSKVSTANEMRCTMCVNVATSRIAQGDYKEAERLLHKALQIVPKSPAALRLLLFIHLKTNSRSKALHILRYSS